MEAKLYDNFCKRRDEGLIVRRVWFRLASRVFFKATYPDTDVNLFNFPGGWLHGFLARWNITLRATTNKAQYIPNHYRILIQKWLQFNRRNSQVCTHMRDYKYEVGHFDFSHIVNMDQTPFPFEYITGKTYAHKGNKIIWVKSKKSGWDKRQATLVPTVFADGVVRGKPLILFRGTEDSLLQHRYYGQERAQYDPSVIAWFNPKGYANTATRLRWINKLLIPAFHPAGQGPAMGNNGPSLLNKR